MQITETIALSPLDIVFIVIILIFTVRCAIRGFISELMSMAAIVLGMLASLIFYKNGGVFVSEKFKIANVVLSEIIAFILIFLIVFLVIKILERILKDIIEGIKMGKADRFLGIIFGMLEGVVVVGLVLFIMNVQPLFDPSGIFEKSFFAGFILPLINRELSPAADTAVYIFFNLRAAANV